MICSIKRIIIGNALLLLMLSGCVVMQTAVEKDAPCNSKAAYLYGKFYMVGYFSGASIALQLIKHSETGGESSSRFIELKQSDDIYAISVDPGSYDFGKIVFLKSHLHVIHEKYLNPKYPRIELVFEPGKAYYLGDFKGEGTYTSMGRSYRMSWQLKEFKDNFEGTTAKFVSEYPRLASINKVNLVKTYQAKIVEGIYEELKELDALIAKPDYYKARTMAQRLADKEIPYAQVRLGYLYENGYGVLMSRETAGKWYKRAAEKNFSDGMLDLGILLLRHGPKSKTDPKYKDWEGIGTRADGFEWIENAALKGNVRAMGVLCSFAGNKGSTPNLRAKNFAWCELAIERVKPEQAKLKAFIEALYSKAKPLMNSDIMKTAQVYKERNETLLNDN